MSRIDESVLDASQITVVEQEDPDVKVAASKEIESVITDLKSQHLAEKRLLQLDLDFYKGMVKKFI